MKIAIPLYDGFTALDAIGPVRGPLPPARRVEVTWLAGEPGPVRSDNGMLGLDADAALRGAARPGDRGRARRYRHRRPCWTTSGSWAGSGELTRRSEWTTSVCTGSLLLGAAGVLDGLDATTHWLDLEKLERFGARPTRERVVEQGKVVTAAGVSSGIDMALTLAARIGGPEVAQAIQLGIEYDPQPPFDAGSEEKAPPEIVDLVRSVVAARAP